MKFAVCSLLKRDIPCYCKPVFDDRPLENIKTTFVRGLKEGLVLQEQATRLKYKNAAFYQIGTFDDETGVLTSIEPICICDCNKVLNPEEVKVDGKYSD